jgi:hypothetical protein
MGQCSKTSKISYLGDIFLTANRKPKTYLSPAPSPKVPEIFPTALLRPPGVTIFMKKTAAAFCVFFV